MEQDKTKKRKPCSKCPWMEKGQPLITQELKDYAKADGWFCCHVNTGTCYGAEIHSKKLKLKEAP